VLQSSQHVVSIFVIQLGVCIIILENLFSFVRSLYSCGLRSENKILDRVVVVQCLNLRGDGMVLELHAVRYYSDKSTTCEAEFNNRRMNNKKKITK